MGNTNTGMKTWHFPASYSLTYRYQNITWEVTLLLAMHCLHLPLGFMYFSPSSCNIFDPTFT